MYGRTWPSGDHEPSVAKPVQLEDDVINDDSVPPGRSALPSYAECREAARSIRRAEFGRDTVNTVRPRGVTGLFRSRAPLPILLYVASREGRLVWRSADSLALLQPPGDLPRAAPGGVRLWLLRQVNRRWEMLLFAGPPVVLLLIVLGLIAIRGLVGRNVLLIGGVSLALLAMFYVSTLMAAMAMFGIRWFYRELGRPPPPGDIVAAELLPGERWSMTLCHHLAPARSDELLRHVELHLEKLITADAQVALDRLGVRAGHLGLTETLVCIPRGVTTGYMRTAVERWSGGQGGELMMKIPGDRARKQPVRLFEAGGFFFWYVGAVLMIILLEAFLVAQWERAACGTHCAGRPADYPSAVRWLAQRLFFTDAPGLSPATTEAWVVGWLTSVMSFTGIGVAIVAVVLYWKYHEKKVKEYREVIEAAHRRTRTLLLVATKRERDAVLEAVRAINGVEPRLRHLPQHTVFELGELSRTEVLLAQSEQGAVGPAASAITAAGLIARLEPDFLVVTGVCFGLRPQEQKLGDVVVSRQLRAIDHRKETDAMGAERRPVTLLRGDFVTPSPTLLRRFSSADVGWRDATVHSGTMLSSSVLVNSKQVRDRLVKLDPEAIGGEMEGAGVYAAAAPEKVDWIVVKAISDWGYDKDDLAQERAARNAASFVVHTVRGGAMDLLPVRAWSR